MAAPIRRNGYYNDPQIAKAFDNIASIFAPPSGSDTAGYATAAAKRAEADRLAQLFAYSQRPDYDRAQFERQAVAAGVYNPSQSYYSVDQGNATSRANNASTNATSIETTRMNNDGALARQFAQPITANQDQTVFLPEQTQRATGLGPTVRGNISLKPGETSTTPSGEVFRGNEVPLSTDQLQARNQQDLQARGVIGDRELRAMIFGNTPIEQVQRLEGPGTEIVPRADAFGRTPAPPVPTGRPANGQAMRDGVMVPTVQKPDGTWAFAQDGAPIPGNVGVTNLPTPQGSNEQLGIGKATSNSIDQQIVDSAVARNTAVQLRDLIQKAPASQGIVGMLRGTAQNFIQSGGEVGQYFGGVAAEVNDRIKAGLADANLAGLFDPNIPAIEMMANLLAFQYAKTTTGERLSNEMLRQARTALGLDGLAANQANSVARIDQAIKMIDQQTNILRGFQQRPTPGGTPAVLPPAGAATPPPNAGTPQFRILSVE